MAYSAFAPGMLVSLPDRRGVATVVATNADRCQVSLFHSVDQSITEDHPNDVLTRAYIGPETRVYVSSTTGWHVGRVKDYDPAAHPWVEYVVKFPNGKTADLSEQRLRVRVFEPHADPAEVLAGGGGETQYFHDRRWRAVASSVALRAAAQGLTGALSARVELAPHQLATVRRILTDPVPRFLLADEVGMGKTIEAGIVARQCLIDNPARRILVLAPGSLTAQWRAELADRCDLDDAMSQIEVAPHEHLRLAPSAPDLLIVDEAHNLLGDATMRQDLERLAHATPRLLLLSATPELGSPDQLLNLLHVLDPEAYGRDDLPKLEARLNLGRDLGRLLLTLTDDAVPFLAKRSAAELASRLPHDDLVAVAAEQLAADIPLGDVLPDLRQHLADNYRVHQRVLRARRRDAALYFQPRGTVVEGRRSHLREEVDEDERWPEVLVSLEDWRDQLNAKVEESNLAPASIAMAFVRSLDDIAADPSTATSADAPASLHTALESSPGERHLPHITSDVMLSLFEHLSRDGVRAPKIVAFASVSHAFPRLQALLVEQGHEAISLTGDLSPDGVQQRVSAFRDQPDVPFLLCDRAGEEGLNLSFADAIVHLDLPFSVTRLEQRIGRLDRFGRSKRQLRQRILLPSDAETSPWAAWLDVLTDGFGIFEASTSDVQFVLADLEKDLAIALLERGAPGLRAMIPEVRNRLIAARKAADEQYALDAIALGDDGGALAEAIEDAEADELELQDATEAWLVSALHLARSRPARDEVSYHWARETLAPKLPWESEFRPGLDRPMTWRRRVALHRNIRLVRPGSGLIDAMDRHLRWDDRGSAFATWRVDPDLPPGDICWTGFRFCFVVEADLARDLSVFEQVDHDGLTRRAQGFLAPWTVQIDLDLDGKAAPETLQGILDRAYTTELGPQGGKDINLCSRPTLLESVVPTTTFGRLCRTLRDDAGEQLRTSAAYQSKVAEAKAGAQRDQRRRTRLGDASGVQEVVDAVSHPRLRLDSMGFFVLSHEPPSRSA